MATKNDQHRLDNIRFFFYFNFFNIFVVVKVLVLDADLDIENIGAEYKRSESSILKPILIENTNQQAIYVSPAKRQRSDY